MTEPFVALAEKPDHPALEREALAWWEERRIFDRLRDQNRGGPRFSFIDGPITANNPMGVHHAWGRTLKDVYQRYKALRGFDQRYQNGFDCQGLWVEVEVEKSLGLNSKREIEEYGLAEFAARCKERVAHFAEVITEQSKRLGMWMDWDNDYYTFSDTNIEYIWRFLKTVHADGWLYKGHRSTLWCPRCGTSLSQHEQAGEGNYVDIEHPSLFVRFPLRGRKGEALAVWTTTPWTLPANVAAAVRPDAEYVLRENGTWVARQLDPDAKAVRTARGEDLVGLEYEGPFDDLPAQEGVVHRVIPWDDVALDEGTGVVHIAPGAGTEDFELSRVHGLPVLAPIDEAGRMMAGYGRFEGLSTDEVERPVIEELDRRSLLIEADRKPHRYPICWRCRTPLLFRVVDDWFIAVEQIRERLLAANQEVAWTPPQYGKRMDDWLRNMEDWNISRKRYFGLPLPFYPCAECETLTVVGSRQELEERSLRGLDQLQELHRPWIDEVTIACDTCGKEVRRIPEVGDAWLDAGIVPLSTLGWENTHRIEGGYGTGAAKGLTGADLPDHAYWEQWFPADWISEMREQIRLWFYSISFMSMTLVGRSPYQKVLTYEKLLDETGREMHRSWGNAIDANEAFDRMGADVMRWLFCEVNPSQNLKFGYGPANEVRRRLLTLWNSAGFLVTYANIAGWRPQWGRVPDAMPEHVLDRWLVARVHSLLRDATAAYDAYDTPRITRVFESFVDDLSNWYIRRSRRRFWDGDLAALWTLWYALSHCLSVVAPVMPFLADHLWRHLVVDGPESVFLAGWPTEREVDESLLADMEEARRVVALGHQARGEIRLRQPLRRMYVRGASGAKSHAQEIAEELRVKEVEFDAGPVAKVRLLPNLPRLGPRLGSKLRDVRAALERGDFEELSDGSYRVVGEELGPDDVLRGERVALEGWSIAEDHHLTVALDTTLDDELRLEGRVLELIHRLNAMRKKAGLELTDRIVVTLPESQGELLEHAEWIKRETLAVELRLDGNELAIAKA